MPHIVDETLSNPAVKVYAALREYWLDYGRCPSKIELRDGTLYSITTVIKALNDLRDKGYIEMPKFGVRSIVLTDFERSLGNTPPDPFATLAPTKKFFRPVTSRTETIR